MYSYSYDEPSVNRYANQGHDFTEDFIELKTSLCRRMCDGMKTSTKELWSHLFIETNVSVEIINLERFQQYQMKS